jgi:hypothetical protein
MDKEFSRSLSDTGANDSRWQVMEDCYQESREESVLRQNHLSVLERAVGICVDKQSALR